MKNFSLTSRCLVFTFLVINFFSCVFAREYVLEVAPDQGGFKISTNISRVGEQQRQGLKKDEPIPSITFNATMQNFLLSEEGRKIEIALDKLGHITVKQLNLPEDTLRIKNTTADGNIIFDGAKQVVYELRIDGMRSCLNEADLSVVILKAFLKRNFVNIKPLTINPGHIQLVKDQGSMISCENIGNRNTFTFNGNITCTVVDFFHNSASINGDGDLTISCVQFLNDSSVPVNLTGALKIEANMINGVKNCNHDYFCNAHCLNSFKPVDQSDVIDRGVFNNKRKDQAISLSKRQKGDDPNLHGRDKFQHSGKPSCHDCFLLGSIKVNDLKIKMSVVELQGSITINNDCSIDASDYLRNSGKIQSKNNIDIVTKEFFNDMNSCMSVRNKLKINAVEGTIANVGATFVAGEIEIIANKFFNSKKERDIIELAPMMIDEKFQDVFQQVDNAPKSFIIARSGNISITVNDYVQDASSVFASNDLRIIAKDNFNNNGRELKRFGCDNYFNRCDKIFDNAYEPSTIAAGGTVTITVNGHETNFNMHRDFYYLPHFINTGIIQGQQILSLQTNDKTRSVNGFTHKSIPAAFSPLQKLISLDKYLIDGEYSHETGGAFYYTHPLFNESKKFRDVHETVIVSGSKIVNKDMPFLMSPLIETLALDSVLYDQAGRIRIGECKDHYEQFDFLVIQGIMYGLIHGTLTAIDGIVDNDYQVKSIPRPVANKDHLLIKIPTRGRPEQFFKTLDIFYENLSQKIPYTFLITCDEDDQTMNNDSVIAKLKKYPNLYFYFGRGSYLGSKSSKVDAYNRDIEKHLDFDILMVASDAIYPAVKNFDQIVFREMKASFPDYDGVLDFNREHSFGAINRCPVIGKKYYSRFDYVYYPKYLSKNYDHEFIAVANAFDKYSVKYISLIDYKKIPHKRGMPVKHLSQNRRPWDYDQDLYEIRKKLDFWERVNHGPEIMQKYRHNKWLERHSYEKIQLTAEEMAGYAKLIESMQGDISPKEFAARLQLLKSKRCIVSLRDEQIADAPVSFIYYKVETRDGKDYLHPYLHPDKETFEKIRHAEGSLEGKDVKITGGNLHNLGLIKADKELLIKVTSFLNEKPLQERLDGIYKITQTKQGGEYQAASATIITQKDLTFKGGTGTATEGDNTLKSTEGSVNILPQRVTNPEALDGSKKSEASKLTAARDNNLDAKKNVDIVDSQTVAGQNTAIKAGGTASVTTTATAFLKKDETTHKGGKTEHTTEQGVAATPATVVSGKDTTMQAGQANKLTGATVQTGDTLTMAAPNNIVQPTVVTTASTDDTTKIGFSSYAQTKTTQTQQSMIPTTIQADKIVMTSDLDTTLEAVVLYGGQLVHIVSGRDTVFKGTELQSSAQQHGWSFGISFLGSSSIQAAVDGRLGDSVISLPESDPLIAAIKSLNRAKDGADKFAAGEYVGIEALRSLVQLSKTVKLPKATGIGQRLGVLDGQGKFSPKLTFSLGYHSASENTWQTVPSQVNAMKFVVESGRKTVFKDGTRVTAQESEVKSNIIEFEAAANKHEAGNMHAGFDITFGAGGIGAGVHGGIGNNRAVHYQNAVFDVGSQTWQAQDMHGQGVTIRGRVGTFNVKNLKLNSVQNTEKAKNVGGGISASQSGAFSGFFNYHSVDNAWINERSSIEFEELHGHTEMLKLLAADVIARQKSTFKADKTEGASLKDHRDTFGFAFSASYSPDDAVPVTADFDYMKQHEGGKQQAYTSQNVETGQTDNVVHNEKDKFVADKKVNTHIHFVAAWIDTQQVKEAYSDLQSLFKKDKVTCQEFNEKMDALKKLGKVRELTDADKVAPSQQSRQPQQQPADSAKAEQTQHDNKPEDKPSAQQNGKTENEVQKELLQPCHYPFKTKSGKTIDVNFVEDNSAGGKYTSEYSAQGVFVVEDQIYDPATKQMQIMLRNNQFRISIKGDMVSLAEVYMDRKMQINGMIAKSHLTHGNDDDSSWLGVASSVVLDFVPIVGNVKMGAEALYGYDLITGQKLEWWQRLICAGAAAAGPVGQFFKTAANGAKAAEVIVDGSKLAKTTTEATKVAEAANEVGKTAKVAEGAAEGAKVAETVGEGAKVGEKIIIDLTKKPSVINQKLQNCVDELYRSGAKIGSGSTADAIRHEISTGNLVGGKSHIQKGIERITNLKSILTKETLNDHDVSVAKALIDDLQSALKGM